MNIFLIDNGLMKFLVRCTTFFVWIKSITQNEVQNTRNMTEETKILTLHPKGKKGVNILRRRYDVVKEFMLDTIGEHGEISYSDLNDLAVDKLTDTFDGKVPWYVVTVKLDLEARGIIERVPKTSPHKVRMKT